MPKNTEVAHSLAELKDILPPVKEVIRNSIESSNIKSIGYDTGTLDVEFSNGTIYRYEPVPPEVYKEFSESETKGGYFAKNIRGKFPHVRIA